MIKHAIFAASVLFSIDTLAFSLTILSPTNAPTSGVVAYLTPMDQQTRHKVESLPFTKANTVISQQDKTFAPYIAVSQRNEDVTFENNDTITHHIYSLNSDDKFDFKIRKGAESVHRTFKNNNEIAMGCNIHDWMAGHLLIVDTPFYKFSDNKGNVNWLDIPDGSYELAIFHPQMSEQDKSYKQIITIPAEETTITLSDDLVSLPTQESLEQFDFIESY